MTEITHINLYGTAADSIVDGPGLRFAVFVQGCSHRCPGCHNPKSQAFEGGTMVAIAELVEEIRKNGLVRDVTISGGEPFDQAAACAELASQLVAGGYKLWTYTGYVYEDLIALDNEAVQTLLDKTDVLVDGPFVPSKRSLGLKYRGSSNQRLIDMNKTRAKGSVTLWETNESFPTKPPSW